MRVGVERTCARGEGLGEGDVIGGGVVSGESRR